MKTYPKIPFLLVIIFLLFTLSGCVSLSPGRDGLVVGENYRLESGETLSNDLTILGGNATIEEDATVEGDVAVIGGNVIIAGAVEGDISVMGGYVELKDNAIVTGDLNTLGGTVRRSAGARVEGQETDNEPSIPVLNTPRMQVSFDPIVGPLTAIFQALALAALAVVLHLFAARLMERTGQTAIAQPVATGGVGVLTVLVAPALLLIMAITILLLPFSLLGVLLLVVAGLFGWLSLGLMLGRQITFRLQQSWSDPISAGVGTLVLSLLSSLLNVIPCVGWLANALVWCVALGAVGLTRFGTQPYPPPAVHPATTLVPTSPVVPSAAPNPPAPGDGARIYDDQKPGDFTGDSI